MSKEEIKDIIEEILQDPFFVFSQDASSENTQIKATAIQGLLDLYNKEKEKNKKLKYDKSFYQGVIDEMHEDYISKDKIREKIKELPTWLTEEEKRGIKFFVNELLEEQENENSIK